MLSHWNSSHGDASQTCSDLGRFYVLFVDYSRESASAPARLMHPNLPPPLPASLRGHELNATKHTHRKRRPATTTQSRA